MVDENLFFELADTLAKTTVDVFKKMAKTDLSIGKASYKEDKEVRGDISSIIGLTGSRKADVNDDSEDAFIDFKAVFVLTWPLEAYIEASNLMLKENYNTYNYEISDVGGEICNVIMGNVKPDFESICKSDLFNFEIKLHRFDLVFQINPHPVSYTHLPLTTNDLV